MSKVVVIGSINMDYILKMDKMPEVGETVIGSEIIDNHGGKGSNQAVAISKLGENVSFLGKVGNDSNGESCLEAMKKNGVNIAAIERTYSNTGLAIVSLDKLGNNNIVVIPGANDEVDKKYIDKNINLIRESSLVLLQLEIPINTVEYSLKLAKNEGKKTILNPAPANDLSDDIISNVDILIPNEHELSQISGVDIKNKEDMRKACSLLYDKGVSDIIVTLGEKGVFHYNGKSGTLFEPYKVEVIDTTGAGDSFIAGFISGYMKGLSIEESIDIGQRVASIVIQKIGAQGSNLDISDFYQIKNNRSDFCE